jgi:hypothetical protein
MAEVFCQHGLAMIGIAGHVERSTRGHYGPLASAWFPLKPTSCLLSDVSINVSRADKNLALGRSRLMRSWTQ